MGGETITEQWSINGSLWKTENQTNNFSSQMSDGLCGNSFL